MTTDKDYELNKEDHEALSIYMRDIGGIEDVSYKDDNSYLNKMFDIDKDIIVLMLTNKIGYIKLLYAIKRIKLYPERLGIFISETNINKQKIKDLLILLNNIVKNIKNKKPIKHYLKNIVFTEKFISLITKNINTVNEKYKQIDNESKKAKFVKTNTWLTIDEFEKLYKSIKDLQKNKESVKQDIIKANLKLVVYLAKKFNNPKKIPLIDLIQEGNIGLIRAVEKFDPSKGYSFATYAPWWINQHISKALSEHGRTIKIPAHTLDQIKKINKITINFLQDTGREPTVQELSALSKISEDKINELMQIKEPISTETTIGGEDDDESMQISDLIADENQLDPLDSAIENDSIEIIKKVLSHVLTRREKKIIEMRFGLDNKMNYTLEEIGQKFKITKERIRQIEEEALIKLKNSEYSNLLSKLI
jgi:RNA polymerase sigma factor (sigma-70 family)